MARAVGRQGDYLKKISLVIRDQLIVNVCEGTPPCPEPIMVLASTRTDIFTANSILYPINMAMIGTHDGGKDFMLEFGNSSGSHDSTKNLTFEFSNLSGSHGSMADLDPDGFTSSGDNTSLGSTII